MIYTWQFLIPVSFYGSLVLCVVFVLYVLNRLLPKLLFEHFQTAILEGDVFKQ